MKRDIKHWIGRRIREARESVGYSSQMAFAAKINLPQPTVSKWENGEHQPSHENLLEIAKITKKPIEFFSPIGDGVSRNDLIVGILEMLPSASEGDLESITALLRKGQAKK